MDLSSISYNNFQIFVLIFFRVAGIIFMAPILNMKNIPVFLKILFSFACAVMFFTFRINQNTVYIFSILQLTIAIAAEIIIGFIIGYISQLVFTAVAIGGQLLGVQTGLGLANILDPIDNSHSSILTNLLNIFAIMIFLSINGLNWFFEALSMSFHTIPIGNIHASPKILMIVLTSFNTLFISGIKIAAPIMGTVLILDAALGILSRIVPQIEIFILSFPFKIAGGLLILALSLKFIALLLNKMFSVLPLDITKLIHLFAV